MRLQLRQVRGVQVLAAGRHRGRREAGMGSRQTASARGRAPESMWCDILDFPEVMDGQIEL